MAEERKIRIVPAYDHADEIRKLFKEYTEMLVEGDPKMADFLALQHYDEEIRNLEWKYGMPEGRLYIVYVDGKAAGCGGFRKLEEDKCELKRIYIRPEYRGHKLGYTLTRKLIRDAADAGYRWMYLDTMRFLDAAKKMYRDLGFTETDRYNDSPVDGTVFLRMELQETN